VNIKSIQLVLIQSR